MFPLSTLDTRMLAREFLKLQWQDEYVALEHLTGNLVPEPRLGQIIIIQNVPKLGFNQTLCH